MADISPSKVNSNSFIEENSYKEKSSKNEKERSNTLNSSKSDSFFNNLNAEIKTFIEKPISALILHICLNIHL